MADGTQLIGLVARARRGDPAAMDHLFRRFAPVVHAVLLGRAPRDEVDDLVQDVFEKVLSRLHELREDAAFPGWLLGIARHAAADLGRRPRPLPVDADDWPAGTASPEDRTEARHVMATLMQLPEAYREPLAMRLVEGMTGPEIAECTGMTHGSVRVNLHRGMALLRAALARPREDA